MSHVMNTYARRRRVVLAGVWLGTRRQEYWRARRHRGIPSHNTRAGARDHEKISAHHAQLEPFQTPLQEGADRIAQITGLDEGSLHFLSEAKRRRLRSRASPA